MTTKDIAGRLSRRLPGFTILGLAVATAACGTPERSDAQGSPPVITLSKAAPVDIEPRFGSARMPRGAHPLARPELDVGRLDPERRIENLSLFFSLSPAQRKDRDALVEAQLDPKSPSYHAWLTPDSYRARFGARPEDIARATTWLASQGFLLHDTSPLGTRVSFGAKVKDLEKAFQTEMHTYRLGAETHYAMATAPALPNELLGVVLGVHNTHDFYAKPISRTTNAGAFARRSAPAPRYTVNDPMGPDGGFQVLGPPDWATAYDVAKLYSPGIGGKTLDGTGVTIGIVGTAAIAQSDIDAFRTTFGLPARTVTMTLVPNTGIAAGGQGGGGVEAILDVEWSGGIAKGANVNYVFTGQDDGNVDDASIYLIEQNIAPVMSESYGGCEAGNVPTDADILETNGTAANLLGITYMASSGDAGAADCVAQGFPGLYVDVPGSFPGVTSVGGTQFPMPTWNSGGNLTSPGLEQVWNESNDPYGMYMGYPTGVGAGGGGISSIFLRPTYQSGAPSCAPVGTLPFTLSAPMRQVPDVALSAASGTPGYYIECTFDSSTQDCAATGGMPFGTPIGGTSASSPSFAGFVAILNQAVGERLGNINPVLYQLEAATTGASPFHDITSGSNEIACGKGGSDAGGPDGGVWPEAGCGAGGLYGYAAIPGYDCASGVGSIDGFNLVTAWLGAVKTETAIVPLPTTTTEGAKVSLTATVTVDGANANPVTGEVTFAFRSYTDTGKLDLSWELGSVTVASGTTTSAQVSLDTTVPPGLVRPGHQQVDVVAFYGGDTNHLPSSSAAALLEFAPVTFAIVPDVYTLLANAAESFSTSGGMTPVRWFVGVDTTASVGANGNYQGSSIDENTGEFLAGPQAGYVEIFALDAFGAEAVAKITVGKPTTPAPWDPDAGVDSGAPRDAGAKDAGHDSGKSVHDSGAGRPRDAGHIKEAAADHATHEDAGAGAGAAVPGGGGCSCEVATGHRSPGERPWLPVGGVVFATLFAAARRRKRQ